MTIERQTIEGNRPRTAYELLNDLLNSACPWGRGEVGSAVLEFVDLWSGNRNGRGAFATVGREPFPIRVSAH